MEYSIKINESYSYAYIELPKSLLSLIGHLLDMLQSFVENTTNFNFYTLGKMPSNHLTSWTLHVYPCSFKSSVQFGENYCTNLTRSPHLWIKCCPSVIISACTLLDNFVSSIIQQNLEEITKQLYSPFYQYEEWKHLSTSTYPIPKHREKWNCHSDSLHSLSFKKWNEQDPILHREPW